jgi:hypothetical protein
VAKHDRVARRITAIRPGRRTPHVCCASAWRGLSVKKVPVSAEWLTVAHV